MHGVLWGQGAVDIRTYLRSTVHCYALFSSVLQAFFFLPPPPRGQQQWHNLNVMRDTASPNNEANCGGYHKTFRTIKARARGRPLGDDAGIRRPQKWRVTAKIEGHRFVPLCNRRQVVSTTHTTYV